MTDLETRLGELSEQLAFDGEDQLVDDVLHQLRARRQPSPWLRAAVAVALLVGVVLALPTSREAVADWFGFGSVAIERLPDDALARADASFDLAGPGDSTIEVVDDREILVSRFDARLSQPLLSKSVGVSTNVIAVEVNGAPGVWIDEGPHEVAYETNEGVGVARTAAQTLLWESDGVVYRLEGFTDLESAQRFAATLAAEAD